MNIVYIIVPRRNKVAEGDIGLPFVCQSVRPSERLEYLLIIS